MRCVCRKRQITTSLQDGVQSIKKDHHLIKHKERGVAYVDVSLAAHHVSWRQRGL
jgi:hypothetical protein